MRMFMPFVIFPTKKNANCFPNPPSPRPAMEMALRFWTRPSYPNGAWYFAILPVVYVWISHQILPMVDSLPVTAVQHTNLQWCGAFLHQIRDPHHPLFDPLFAVHLCPQGAHMMHTVLLLIPPYPTTFPPPMVMHHHHHLSLTAPSPVLLLIPLYPTPFPPWWSSITST